MMEREQIEQAIAALERQRASLGNEVVDAAIAGLRQQIAASERPADQDRAEPTPLALAGERRFVTVMYADISGFVALADKSDPETVRDLMNGCFERLVPVIERFRGTVDKFIGDSIMALFGAPIAHENAPESALRAALEMMDALARFNADHGTNLGMHMGINTGPVIAGTLGTAERQAYSVMGDAVNIASRLEQVSERGEILVGQDTYSLTASWFEFRPPKAVRVKGKPEPIMVYRLVSQKAAPERVGGLQARGISSPLVGRDAELAALQGCIKRLLEGHGGCVSIIGEAGLGKSRLVAELRTWALERPPASDTEPPLMWLEGRTLSFGQSISYWPFQDILRQYAGIGEEDLEATAWNKLESHCMSLLVEQTPEILPYLGTLLTLDVPDALAERVRYLDSEAMRRQVFLASRRFFERLAHTQPLVLIFDNLHWADESSVNLLEHLLPLVSTAPLLLIAVSRPDQGTPGSRLRQTLARDYAHLHTAIHLAHLSSLDSAQLVRNLLDIGDLSSSVCGMIVRRAEGNPFFLEEVIRSLIDANAVVRDPTTGRWRATSQVEATTIPDTIQEVIMARVDRLSERVKKVLRTAAVIGRTFPYRVLRAVERSPEELEPQLATLQAMELVREKRQAPELEYIFKHALVQEVVYGSILAQDRRELHALVGDTMEALYPDRLEECYGLLAYHYAQAETWEKAQEYLLKAGDQAVRVAADAEALAHYEQALQAYARAFGDQWDPLQRAALERRIGEALFRRGEQIQALDYLKRALTYLHRPLPASLWGARVGILREIVRQVGHRLLPGLFLRPVDEASRAAAEKEVDFYEPIGWMAGWTDPELLLFIVLKAMNVSERFGLRYGTVVGSVGLGTVCDGLRISALASSYHRRGMDVATQMHHSGALTMAHMGLTMHHSCLGQWDLAMAYCGQAIQTCRETGNLHGWGHVTAMLANALNYQGNFGEAIARCREIVRLGREGDDRQVQCWGLWAQGFGLHRLGRIDEAVAALQEAVSITQAIPDYGTFIAANAELGRCYVHQGEVQQALATLQASQQALEEHPTAWGNDSPLVNGLAEVHLLLGEQAEEDRQAQRWEEARRACRRALRHARGYRGAMPEAMLLQGRYQWLKGQERDARRSWEHALALARELRQRYDQGMIHLEVGLRTGDPIHLRLAESMLGETGAEHDLSRAHSALTAPETIPAGERA